MRDKSVELFLHQMVEVSSRQWTAFSLMVSLVCLLNARDAELNISACLTLRPCLNRARTGSAYFRVLQALSNSQGKNVRSGATKLP